MKAPYDPRPQIYSVVARNRQLNKHESLGGSVNDAISEQDESSIPQSASIDNFSRVDDEEFFDAVENDETSENM